MGSNIGFPPYAGSSSSNGHPDGFFGHHHSPSPFQHNPLSAHPPRTPRPSSVSHSYIYSTEAFQPNGDTRPKITEAEEVSGSDLEDARSDTKSKTIVTGAEVWRDVIKTSAGRDKVFKIMQYGLRLYILSHNALWATELFRKTARSKWNLELMRRLETTTSGLSLTRKCLIMFNWLTPLTSILALQPTTFSINSIKRQKQPPKSLLHTLLHAPPPMLLDLVNGLSDDIYAYSRLGLIGKTLGERAGRFSDWCWFAGTLVALVELNFERAITKNRIQAAEAQMYRDSMSGATVKSAGSEMKYIQAEIDKLRRQDFWLKVQRTKLLMDLIFVSYNVFQFKWARDVVKTVTGLLSAILSSARIYHTQRNTLIAREVRR